ncbi:lipoprotein-releasing ABC transporter permease subunit [Spongiibacter nanhainus]|uniref:Lipoprotein-releasing ABC transporter permease subunit n=1 Tax=Spongiibacter nanhainus TaxID=2794344 RepID=A0A7T4QXQ2_9GAMM|nr:lipoprotein-releasing ABC transporter permease subunit [Spongiibacter nanhainus]QQD16720.1 lipoprotein-releasing ABC transporter permease subunit [Spongiibacter nanhainus]
MSPAFPLYIGLRYFRRGSGNDRFLSLIAWFSLLGMLLGVVALVVVTSVMNGFESELQKRVLSVVPHAYIDGPGQALEDWQDYRQQLSELPGVNASAPYIGGKAMLSAGGEMRGVNLYGIAPDAERQVSKISEHIVGGSYLSESGPAYGIVLGDILSRRLRLSVGDTVTVILPKVTVTPFGLFPREKAFTIVGIFSAGAQTDSTTAFIRLEDAQRLYQTGSAVQGLRVQFNDMFAAPAKLSDVLAILPDGASGVDWTESQGSLFRAVKLEKQMVRLLLLFIVLIAAFNIVSILSMAVANKRGAVAVLRTMGATPMNIMAIFVVYGMTTGVLGLGLGLLIGLPLATHVGEVVALLENLLGLHVFDPQVYFITRIPSLIRWQDIAFISVFSLVLSLLATLYPAWRGSRVQPAEALRYE